MITVVEEVVMAKTSKGTRAARWTEAQARAVLADLARSGVSVSRFAERRGLGVERLYRWRRRLGRVPARLEAPRFAEVTVRPTGPPAAIEIELVGGVALRVAGETRVDDVIAILSRLPVR